MLEETGYNLSRQLKAVLPYKCLICIFALLFVTIIVLLSGFLWRYRPNRKSVQVEREYDFGFIYPGEICEHTFKVINDYKKPMRLHKIKSSCGCLVTRVADANLLPGETTNLGVKVQAKNYPDNLSVSTIALWKSGDHVLTYKYILRAKVANVIQFSKSSPIIRFEPCGPQDLPQRSTIGITRGSHPLEWDTLKCQSDTSAVKTNLRQTSPDNWIIELILDEVDCYGAINTDIEFSFWKDGRRLNYSLVKPVSAAIVGPVMVSPSSLLIGAVRKGERIEKTLKLANTQNNPQPIEIVSIDCPDSNGIEAKLTSENSQQAISVIFIATGEEGPQSGSLFIQAKLDKIYKIKVRYFAYIVQ